MSRNRVNEDPQHTATRMRPRTACMRKLRTSARGAGPDAHSCRCCCSPGNLRSRSRRLHAGGSYAGVCGHTRPLASAKTSRIPSPACMHKHGKLARVRWSRVPTIPEKERRSVDEVSRHVACVIFFVKFRLTKKYSQPKRLCCEGTRSRKIFSKRLCCEGTRSDEQPRQHWLDCS